VDGAVPEESAGRREELHRRRRHVTGDGPEGVEPPQLPGAESAFGLEVSRIEPALVADLHRSARCPDVVEHGQCFLDVDSHRLFAEDRDAGVHARRNQARMRGSSGGNDQAVDAGLQQGFNGRLKVRTYSGGQRAGVVCGHVGQLEVDRGAPRIQQSVQAGDVPGVHSADPADSHQAKGYFLHAAPLLFQVSLLRCPARFRDPVGVQGPAAVRLAIVHVGDFGLDFL